MRAVVATAFGEPSVLVPRDLDDPEPSAGQVLVDVRFCDVGTLDRLVRSGWGRDHFAVDPPYVPGDGVGGVVRAVGAGVARSWIGRTVIGGTGPRNADGLSIAPIGGYADTALVDARALVAVPAGLDLAIATALVNDGPTSQLLVEVARPGPGDVVLVTAAAGAAGVLLTQLASASGATVVAAAHGPTKTAALRALGIEHVVDYGEPNWADRIRRIVPGGPSVIFDGAGAALGQVAFGLAADGARMVTYGSSAGEFAAPDPVEATRRHITVTGLFDLPKLTAERRNTLVGQAFRAATTGQARPVITQRPLDQAHRAHEALEHRTAIGKTLLVT